MRIACDPYCQRSLTFVKDALNGGFPTLRLWTLNGGTPTLRLWALNGGTPTLRLWALNGGTRTLRLWASLFMDSQISSHLDIMKSVRTIIGLAFSYSVEGLRIYQKESYPRNPQTTQCYLHIVCTPKKSPCSYPLEGTCLAICLRRQTYVCFHVDP